MLYLLGCSTYEYPETVRKKSSSVSASILPVEREITSGGQLRWEGAYKGCFKTIPQIICQ